MNKLIPWERSRRSRYSLRASRADLSGDGKLDLIAVAGNRDGSVTVLLNDGAGRFRSDRAYSSGAIAPALAVGDVNREGVVDVLTANLGRRDLGVLLGVGGGDSPRSSASAAAPSPVVAATQPLTGGEDWAGSTTREGPPPTSTATATAISHSPQPASPKQASLSIGPAYQHCPA